MRSRLQPDYPSYPAAPQSARADADRPRRARARPGRAMQELRSAFSHPEPCVPRSVDADQGVRAFLRARQIAADMCVARLAIAREDSADRPSAACAACCSNSSRRRTTAGACFSSGVRSRPNQPSNRPSSTLPLDLRQRHGEQQAGERRRQPREQRRRNEIRDHADQDADERGAASARSRLRSRPSSRRGGAARFQPESRPVRISITCCVCTSIMMGAYSAERIVSSTRAQRDAEEAAAAPAHLRRKQRAQQAQQLRREQHDHREDEQRRHALARRTAASRETAGRCG